MFSSVVSGCVPASAGSSAFVEPEHGVLDRQRLVVDAQRLGAGVGIAHAGVRGEAVRHHDGAHARRAERVDGDGGNQRAIDAARQPEDDPGKPVLLDVVAHAEHASLIGGRVAGIDDRALAYRAPPAAVGLAPFSERQLLLPGGKLCGEALVGIEHERGAVEHELVLTADLVDVEERQAALDDATDGDVHAHVGLGPIERRAVGRDEDLRAGLAQALDDVGTPDILANRHAKAHAAKIDRTGHRPRREHALFVEHAVVRQVDLETHRFDLAVIDQHDGVVDVAVLRPHGACDDRRSGPQLAGQRLHTRPRGGGKCRLEHQILRRVAGDEQLGEHDEVGAQRSGARTHVAQLGDVAVDVADDWVRLSDRDLEVRGSGRHGLRGTPNGDETRPISRMR